MPQSSRTWDVFCRVIDNYGDVGVCWRLARQLAHHGQRVRLWLDDATALAWMAPAAARPANVRILPWTDAMSVDDFAALQPADVWIEGFGCNLPEALIAQRAARVAAGKATIPHWINLEYLSAEPYVARMHELPSPVQTGPAQGWMKRFFYPGFTSGTGGLLREEGLLARRDALDRSAWLAGLGLSVRSGERVISLFCYEPPALAAWLERLAAGAVPTHVLVTPGRAAAAVRACWGDQEARGAVSLHTLPRLSQDDYDALLWACDFNCVRGEDSLVRALWAGRPFVWQPYPQSDGAHAAKLDAFLNWLDAPADWRRFHAVWSGLAPGPLPALQWGAWGASAAAACARAAAQPDLVTQLLNCVWRDA